MYEIIKLNKIKKGNRSNRWGRIGVIDEESRRSNRTNLGERNRLVIVVCGVWLGNCRIFGWNQLFGFVSKVERTGMNRGMYMAEERSEEELVIE